jgi:hypothetical protein
MPAESDLDSVTVDLANPMAADDCSMLIDQQRVLHAKWFHRSCHSQVKAIHRALPAEFIDLSELSQWKLDGAPSIHSERKEERAHHLLAEEEENALGRLGISNLLQLNRLLRDFRKGFFHLAVNAASQPDRIGLSEKIVHFLPTHSGYVFEINEKSDDRDRHGNVQEQGSGHEF